MIRKVRIVKPGQKLLRWWEVTLDTGVGQIVLPMLRAKSRSEAEAGALEKAKSRWADSKVVSSQRRTAVA